MKKILKIFFIIFGSLFLFGLLIYGIEKIVSKPNQKMLLGVSFSPEYTRYLGLDEKETYRVILDEWHFRYLRLTARWDDVESQKNKFDFTDLDYLVGEAARRQAKVVLAMGQKTPRWPECNVPAWAENLSDADYLAALNNYLVAVATHYKNNPALEIYQVENEPFVNFGKVCRPITDARLQAEIAAVKSADNSHPVLVTDSGELSLWRHTATAADYFGTTVYRVVWNSWLGYIQYRWLPAFYYRYRALWQGRNLDTAWVAELQAEPWVNDHKINTDNLVEQFKSMDLNRLQKNLIFAQTTGFSRAYLWGAEWWYWLKLHGHSEIADFVAKLNN